MSVGERNVFEDLPAQRALADRLQPGLQVGEILRAGEVGELGFEAFQVAERVVVNDADQTEEFQERVLQGCRGEEDFRERGDSVFDGVGDAVGRLVNVSEPVRLINHNEIPIHLADVGVVWAGEVVRANDYGLGLAERV